MEDGSKKKRFLLQQQKGDMGIKKNAPSPRTDRDVKLRQKKHNPEAYEVIFAVFARLTLSSFFKDPSVLSGLVKAIVKTSPDCFAQECHEG